MCVNLNQMLHSYFIQPKTNVYSLICCPLYIDLSATVHSSLECLSTCKNTYEVHSVVQWVDCRWNICQNRIHLWWMSWISSPSASKSKIKSILNKLFDVWSLYFPSSVNTIVYCMIYQQLKIHFSHVAPSTVNHLYTAECGRSYSSLYNNLLFRQ